MSMQKNSNEYIEKLNNLKSEYLDGLNNLKGKKAVILNEAFEYMADELGLDMITIKTDHEGKYAFSRSFKKHNRHGEK